MTFEDKLQKPRIAAIRSDASKTVQAQMAAFALDLRARGFAVAGVAQTRVLDENTGRNRIVLRDLQSGDLYPISQDLGPGSVACNLDAGELALACAAVERAAAQGADLIVLSKFSKQEASRGGLSDAFRCAILAKIPVIAAVSPDFLEEWDAFAGHLSQFVEPSHAALEAWWREMRSDAPLTSPEART
jgi:hypothetical protein